MAYSFQTFVFEQVLTSAQMNQVEVNIRDHRHGENSVVAAFPSGTVMLFRQTAAPAGWTKDTSASLNDTALRIVTGAITDGGSVNFSSIFGAAVTTEAHTLTISEIPAHTHGIDTSNTGSTAGAVNRHQGNGAADGDQTGSTGGGGSHTHDLSLDLQFNDVIVASAD